MADKPTLGTFCWNELMTSDATATRAFYGALFGWKMVDMPMPDGTYTVLRNRGKDVGGLMQIRPNMGEMTSHWMAYVMVEDVDATMRKAAELGAKVYVAGMNIPNIGRFGLFQDPTGAMLSVFQPLAVPRVAKPTARKAKQPAKRAARKSAKSKSRRR